MLEFKNPRDPENVEITRLIKGWVRQHFELGEEVSIFVSEVNCQDDSCPVKETAIVLFFEKGEKKLSIHKPLTFIRERDVKELRLLDSKS
jgi:hypothetical protein